MMVGVQSTLHTRKDLGAWYTPEPLIDLLCDQTIEPSWATERAASGGGKLRILDPACGDGRLLVAARDRLERLGLEVEVHGADIDPAALEAARRQLGPAARLQHADALEYQWTQRFDLVIGNPPFRSQMAERTSRGGSSRYGGGPYADTAAEFLALAGLVTAEGGRIAMILPQSILASRDAAEIRSDIDRSYERLWSWWSPEQWFDATVLVCAIGLARHGSIARANDEYTGPTQLDRHDEAECGPVWSSIITTALGIPEVGALATDGTLGERCWLNANFRDEYYGLVPAVTDGGDGPPLVTVGLIDPGVCLWGRRPVRFNRQRFEAPRVAIERLDEQMRAWAARKLVPKVLVANQTRIIEAVADHDGAWLPGVPITTAVPDPLDPQAPSVAEIEAVLTSPVASALVWHHAAGTGLSARAIRLGPDRLAALPWPAGALDDAVDALAAGDPAACGAAVVRAFGLDANDPLQAWWEGLLPARRGLGPPIRNT